MLIRHPVKPVRVQHHVNKQGNIKSIFVIMTVIVRKVSCDIYFLKIQPHKKWNLNSKIANNIKIKGKPGKV